MEIISPIISIVSLCVSMFTAWFTIFRRGTIKSTQPSFVALRYDYVGKPYPQAKIFLRTLLFSTGKRGLVIEHLFLRVREAERFEEFSFWGHGDKDLVRGSGLFVGDNGVVMNHHFNPIHCETLFRFRPGRYDLELVAKIVNRERLITLSNIILNVPDGAFENDISPYTAIFFNWSPERSEYISSIERREMEGDAQQPNKSLQPTASSGG